MLVKRLDVAHYEDAWNSRLSCVRDPSWMQIEEAIRRLDRFHYPWVWLRLTEEETDCDYLTVMGGEGAYWIALTSGEHDQLRLFDPEKSGREVELWTSDQGFSDHEFHVAYDLELVLQVARYFIETGQPLPAATWEP